MHPAKTMKLMGDTAMIKILAVTGEEPRSVAELAALLGISPASAYRKVEALVKKGLLIENGRRLTRTGKRQTVYLASIKGLRIRFRNGKLSLRFEYRPAAGGTSPDNEIDKVWDVLNPAAA